MMLLLVCLMMISISSQSQFTLYAAAALLTNQATWCMLHVLWLRERCSVLYSCDLTANDQLPDPCRAVLTFFLSFFRVKTSPASARWAQQPRLLSGLRWICSLNCCSDAERCLHRREAAEKLLGGEVENFSSLWSVVHFPLCAAAYVHNLSRKTSASTAPSVRADRRMKHLQDDWTANTHSLTNSERLRAQQILNQCRNIGTLTINKDPWSDTEWRAEDWWMLPSSEKVKKAEKWNIMEYSGIKSI